jgi:hypothetical protein
MARATSGWAKTLGRVSATGRPARADAAGGLRRARRVVGSALRPAERAVFRVDRLILSNPSEGPALPER